MAANGDEFVTAHGANDLNLKPKKRKKSNRPLVKRPKEERKKEKIKKK